MERNEFVVNQLCKKKKFIFVVNILPCIYFTCFTGSAQLRYFINLSGNSRSKAVCEQFIDSLIPKVFIGVL